MLFKILKVVVDVVAFLLKARRPRRSRYIRKSVKLAVAQRDGWCCRHCGSGYELEFDHVIPFSWGGDNSAKNVQLLCGPCNRRKSNRYAG